MQRTFALTCNSSSGTLKISDIGCTGYSLSRAISPDGSRIRVQFTDMLHYYTPQIWEMNADGTEAPPLPVPIHGWRGFWSPDGRIFFFEKADDNLRDDLWFLFDHAGFLRRARPPVRLTNGPLGFTDPVLSRDGKHIYAIGYLTHGELVRYDFATRLFLPALDGISARDVMYSSDGKWMIYLSYPDHSLWRARADGSERLQLTYSPMLVFGPHISPDGDQVCFLGYFPQRAWGTYIIPMTGGDPKQVVEIQGTSSSWSQDGKALLAEVPAPKTSPQDADASQLAFFNLESHSVASIPGSQGKSGPLPAIAADCRCQRTAEQTICLRPFHREMVGTRRRANLLLDAVARSEISVFRTRHTRKS